MPQLKEHKHPAGNLNDLKWIRKIENPWRAVRIAVQRRSILLTRNGRGSLHRPSGIEPRLPPRRKRRAESLVDGIHAGDSWRGTVRILHPNTGKIVRQ